MEFHQDVEKKFAEMSGQVKKQYREEGEREVGAWIILGEVLESIGEKSKSKTCAKYREGVFG